MTKTAKKYTVKCSEKDCNKYYYARGLCKRHYKMLLGREGGYAKEYVNRKNNPKYKEMKSKSEKKYRDRLSSEGLLKERQLKYYYKYMENENNIEKRKQRAKEYYAKTKEIKKEIRAAQQRRYRDELKEKVLSHYSGGKLECNHCGIDVVAVLTIDHIDNNGAVHKRTLSKNGRASSSMIYKNIIDNNFPKEYQVLCFNCNYLKEFMRKC